jgi:sugar lactone lactonase YvrE
MKKLLPAILFALTFAGLSAHSQTSVAFQHPRDQIALQLGAIQMGYTVPFALATRNSTNAQQAANALAMGRNALDATVAKPAVKVNGFVSSPNVDTVEYRDQLYQAVEAVVTSPVAGSIRGSATLVGGKKQNITATLAPPPNAHTIPVPFAVEAATSVDAQNLRAELVSVGLLSQVIFESNVTVTTLAGSGFQTYADGQGLASSFNAPRGVAVDGSGNVFVADTWNNRIRKITPGGNVTTLAGGGFGYSDGQGTAAGFFSPYALAVDGSGNVYVADSQNNRVRKISPTGNVTTLAGSGNETFADGLGTAASFNDPTGVAVDGSGNVYVADSRNHRIRKITPSGNVTTLAGGVIGYSDGQGIAASFNRPWGITVDASGNVYVADTDNHRIRKISAAGNVTTLAGSGSRGAVDAAAAAASFNYPRGVALDGSGNLFIADVGNYRIRKISSTGNVTTLAGSGEIGVADGQGDLATFDEPYGVAVDANGIVYVADKGCHRIRKITISK